MYFNYRILCIFPPFPAFLSTSFYSLLSICIRQATNPSAYPCLDFQKIKCRIISLFMQIFSNFACVTEWFFLEHDEYCRS